MDNAVENTWWDKTVGSKPDEENINRQNGMKEQRGSRDGNRLIMLSRPGRVDWTLEATGEVSSDVPELPTLGPLSDDTLDPFVEIVKNWLNECPPVNRLALRAVLGKPTADAQAGYREIQPYLPTVQLNPHGISNFLYQINRPRESMVSPGMVINRLSRWAVVLVDTIGVTTKPSTPNADANIQGQQYICRLDLDIHTTLLGEGVVKDDAYEIFQELVLHGQEIASKGDVP